MKRKRLFMNFNLMAIYILLGLSTTLSVYGEDSTKKRPSNSNSFDIQGTVIDMTPDISEESFAKLEHAASDEESRTILEQIMKCEARSNAIVTLTGNSVKQKVITNSQGNFKFVALSAGDYELSAEAPSRLFSTGMKRIATGTRRIKIGPSGDQTSRIKLDIHAYPIIVRGRITANGQPVAKAKVTGTPVPFQKNQVSKTVVTASNADGSYELQGFIPPNLYRIAGYLLGGDPLEGGLSSEHFYVEISVEADGFVQDKKDVPRVPLVTEELLVPACRLKEIMLQAAERSNSKEKELQDARQFRIKDFPSSKGNTITGIDIILEKAEENAQ